MPTTSFKIPRQETHGTTTGQNPRRFGRSQSRARVTSPDREPPPPASTQPGAAAGSAVPASECADFTAEYARISGLRDREGAGSRCNTLRLGRSVQTPHRREKDLQHRRSDEEAHADSDDRIVDFQQVLGEPAFHAHHLQQRGRPACRRMRLAQRRVSGVSTRIRGEQTA